MERQFTPFTWMFGMFSLIMVSGLVLPSSVSAVTTSAEYLRILTAEGNDQRAGVSVSGAGDVNGDGYEDAVVGVTHYGEDTQGAVYLIYGKANKHKDFNLGDASNNVARFKGESLSDKLGEEVAGIGDVNGDGYDDIAVGTRYHDSGGNRAGVAYIIYGKATKYTSGSIEQFDKILGNADNQRVGTSMAAAGDINADGFDDFMIGVPRYNDPGTVFVVYGSDEQVDTNLENHTEFIGADDYDRLGYAVAGGGDINGDGYDDMVLGAYRSDLRDRNAGAAYIVYGQAAKFSNQSVSGRPYFGGEESSDQLGESVALAGDVNGDGYDDVVLGAPESDYRGEDAGVVYLVYGKSIKFGGAKNVEDEGVRFYADREEHLLGFSVDGLGDTNNDGYSDIVLGAPGNTSTDPGRAYIVYGKAETYTDTDVDSVISFEGELGNYEFGYDVRGVDLNGDGKGDLIAGDPQYDNQGAAFIAYFPVRTCDNSAATGGILADYPKAEYKHRKYKKNERLRIVVERNGKNAFLVNCITDEVIQTLEFNKKGQRKILARVFSKRGVPMFVAATRTKDKRSIKIYLYKQKKNELVLTDYVKRRWRPRGFRLKLHHNRHILLQKGKENKHQVLYRVRLNDLKLELLTDN